MVGVNANRNDKSQATDWLIAVWTALCTLAFVLLVLPRLAIYIDKWIRLGRCVYALALAICLVAFVLRAIRTRIGTESAHEKSRRVQ